MECYDCCESTGDGPKINVGLRGLYEVSLTSYIMGDVTQTNSEIKKETNSVVARPKLTEEPQVHKVRGR